ncbi:winged helix-turn-helix transcriptional regulator [Pseudonocardia endophytica]|uniref:HxlR family transcriptional regulator n=1 Tax=Pseudonocardia endophytica TaxID=401976 RepID=A0A4R1HWP0_PSEEN|nr:HxlR family transcriptional regulator [Pseudonocardia endophytica]
MTTGFTYTDFDSESCSIARTAHLLGDPWTVLLVRDLRNGVHRFDELARHLGIARNVLTRRLSALVDRGVVEKVEYREPGRRARAEYRLTALGRDLGVVLSALMQFGDRHLDGGAGPPVVPRHVGCGAPIRLVSECAAGHRITGSDAIEIEPGPGARPRPGRTGA